MAAQRIDGLGALGDQQLARAQRNSVGLLGGRLDRHPAHRWPAGGLADRLRVVPVGLAALDKRLDVLRRDQSHPVAQPAQRARPMVRTAYASSTTSVGASLVKK